MRYKYQWIVVLLLCAIVGLLSACGAGAAVPVPQTQVTPTQLPPAQGTTDDATAHLKAQLLSDQILVNSVTLATGSPAVLTIDYQFNEHDVANTPFDIGGEILVETERVVRAATARIVEQVQAGTKIDQVVLQLHFAKGDTPNLRRISVADMQAWTAHQISDDEYRARWCCNVQPPNSSPTGYPAPSGRGYP